MAIVVREADLNRDKDVLIATLNENRERKSDQRRYDWLYLGNPRGRARAWVAEDDRTGRMAGFTAVFPRTVYVEGEELLGWNCGDFSINKAYRTLGVALKLRLAATRAVDEGAVPFLYAHPNNGMKLVHARAGHTVLGEMVRYVRAVRIDRLVPAPLGGSSAGRALAWVYNRGLSAVTRSWRSGTAFRTELHDGVPSQAPFGELQEQMRRKIGVFGQRSPEHLTWRFGRNPMLRASTLLVYRKEDGLIGYAIFSDRDGTLYVNDAFCTPERGGYDALVDGLVESAEQRDARLVSVSLLESNPLIATLRRKAFWRRPQRSTVVVHTSQRMARRQLVYDKSKWFMTVGDRDV